MSTPTFDTLKFAETLKAGGVPEPQAKAFTTAFATAVEEGAGQGATRQDLKDTESTLRQEIKDTASTLRQEINSLDVRLSRLETQVTEGFNHLNRVVYGVGIGILLLLVRGFWTA